MTKIVLVILALSVLSGTLAFSQDEEGDYARREAEAPELEEFAAGWAFIVGGLIFYAAGCFAYLGLKALWDWLNPDPAPEPVGP